MRPSKCGAHWKPHEKNFGVRPQGLWPSEGSVSEEVIALAAKQGIRWMATDEGVLGRSLDYNFSRDPGGWLHGDGAHKLYNIYRYHKGATEMHLLFRDHRISDNVGFVYSGMPAQDAANHLIHSIKNSAQPVLDSGRDAVVSIILDGENAWEYYPQSGREFLRRFYDGLQQDSQIEAVTISEAIERHKPEHFATLDRLVPGSGSTPTLTFGLARPRTIARGTCSPRPVTTMTAIRIASRKPNASWHGRSCSLPRAATGTGGTALSIIRRTTKISTSFIAGTCRMSTTRSKVLRRRS